MDSLYHRNSNQLTFDKYATSKHWLISFSNYFASYTAELEVTKRTAQK
jgi:hypothetical protein